MSSRIKFSENGDFARKCKICGERIEPRMMGVNFPGTNGGGITVHLHCLNSESKKARGKQFGHKFYC